MQKDVEDHSYLPLSEMDEFEPALRDGAIHSSFLAKRFHENLLGSCDLQVVASYLYGTQKGNQLRIWIWVEDDEESEKILKHRPFIDLFYGDPYFKEIVEALYHEDVREAYPLRYEKIGNLWEAQQRDGRGKIYLSVHVVSYYRASRDNLCGLTASVVTERLREHFPQYPRLQCFAYSVDAPDCWRNHLIMFFTPEDRHMAEENGDLARMKALCYKTVKEYDFRDVFDETSYQPQVGSLRHYTKEQLFNMSRG